jgi:hypothetical protein
LLACAQWWLLLLLPLLLLAVCCVQVWAPSLSSADGPEENKLVAVAATKCLTESADVYAATPLWQQLRSALDAKLAGATRSRRLGAQQSHDQTSKWH